MLECKHWALILLLIVSFYTSLVRAFHVTLVVKNLPANAGDVRDVGSILGAGRSKREWQPASVFLPGESHGQRTLVGYSA